MHVQALQAGRELAVSGEVDQTTKIAGLAQRFEGLLLQRLIKVMRGSTEVLSGGEGTQYMAMMDTALADFLADNGGIGLAGAIEEALSRQVAGDATAAAELSGLQHALQWDVGARAAVEYGAAADPQQVQKGGGVLAQAAWQLMQAGRSQWGQAGRLGPNDLRSDFQSPAAGGGTAHFNVRDAGGYEGHPKCNLFALEVARRAGYQVPVVRRDVGWGYPGADALTSAARRGEVPWGRVVTGAGAEALRFQSSTGQQAFLLTGAGQGEHDGHMAVVDRIRRVDYDDAGHIRRVEFDGWEARLGGAEYLQGRVWRVGAGRPGRNVRRGLQGIEVIQLLRAPAGQRPEQPQTQYAPHSMLDSFSLRSSVRRPNHGAEDDS